MPEKLFKTKGIVLRTIAFGETSVISTVFTELFGIQSYLVNGVRVSGKKGSGRANLFQPASQLELVVYHNELKQLNRIKEFRWSYIYQQVHSDVPKNSVALYMVELLLKCLKQPEPHPELFAFTEDCFRILDNSSRRVTANLPLFFALHLAHFFGLRLEDNFSSRLCFLDLQEGVFVSERPPHPNFLEEKQAEVCSQVLKTMNPDELENLPLNQGFRSRLLQAFEQYYKLHISDFGTMKTLPVLTEVLG